MIHVNAESSSTSTIVPVNIQLVHNNQEVEIYMIFVYNKSLFTNDRHKLVEVHVTAHSCDVFDIKLLRNDAAFVVKRQLCVNVAHKPH